MWIMHSGPATWTSSNLTGNSLALRCKDGHCLMVCLGHWTKRGKVHRMMVWVCIVMEPDSMSVTS